MIGGIAGYFQRSGGNFVEEKELDSLSKAIGLLGPQQASYETKKITDQVYFSRMILPMYDLSENHIFFPKLASSTIVASALILNKRQLSTILDLTINDDDALFILKAYQYWGTACLDHLEGKFSFVLWDETKQHLFCAKGPTGMTDLVYYLDDNRFIFGTEIKSVLAQLDYKPELNPLFIAEHLDNFVSERKGTTYQGIYHVLPAHAMLVTKEEVKEWCYWEPGKKPPLDLSTDDAYVVGAQQLLNEVLQGYVDSGLKIGLQTGGGMNATLLASSLTALTQKPLTGVSYCLPKGYTGDLQDEKKYTDVLANHLGMEIHYVNESAFPAPYDEDIELKMKQQDSQIVNPVGSDHYVVYGKMRELGVQLCITTGFKSLDWDGRDVLIDFVSQGKFFEAWNFNRRFLNQSTLKKIVFPLFPNVINQLRKIKYTSKPQKAYQFLTNSNLANQLHLANQKEKSIELTKGRYETINFSNDQLKAIKKRLYGSRKYISAQEYRYNFVMVNPMQDRRLIDFSLSIPRKQHILDGSGRSLLRRMLVGRVPVMFYQQPSTCSYPADMRDRWLHAKPHVFAHLEAIPEDAEVWNYVKRNYVLGLCNKVKKSSNYIDWRKNREVLNKVILLDRFLRFNTSYFNT